MLVLRFLCFTFLTDFLFLTFASEVHCLSVCMSICQSVYLSVSRYIPSSLAQGLLFLTVLVILQVTVLVLLLMCCIALRRQFSRQHFTHSQNLAALAQEINDLKQLLTKHQQKETNSLTNHHITSHLTNNSSSYDPLTLSSLNITQDDVTDLATGSNGFRPTTTATADLVAAMATRSHPANRQQKPRQEVRNIISIENYSEMISNPPPNYMHTSACR